MSLDGSIRLPDGREVPLLLGAEDTPDDVADEAFAVRSGSVVYEQVPKRADDVVLIPHSGATVDDILNSPHARAQREQRDAQVLSIAERLGWTLEEKRETTAALDRGMEHLRHGLAAQQRLEDRIGYSVANPLRSIDLTMVEGKTHEEVAELFPRTVNVWGHAFVDPSQERTLWWHEADGQWHPDKEAFVNSEPVSREMARELRRGMVAGAALTLGLGLAWAALDRAWSAWRT